MCHYVVYNFQWLSRIPRSSRLLTQTWQVLRGPLPATCADSLHATSPCLLCFLLLKSAYQLRAFARSPSSAWNARVKFFLWQFHFHHSDLNPNILSKKVPSKPPSGGGFLLTAATLFISFTINVTIYHYLVCLHTRCLSYKQQN